MEVLPSFRWLKVFSQPWEGDVTMVLPSTFMQIKKSITNPSIDDLKDACLQVASACCYFFAVHGAQNVTSGLPCFGFMTWSVTHAILFASLLPVPLPLTLPTCICANSTHLTPFVFHCYCSFCTRKPMLLTLLLLTPKAPGRESG